MYEGVDAAFSGMEGPDVLITVSKFGAANRVTMLSAATQTALSDPVQYPFKAQTTPNESFQGMVLQDIFCHENQGRMSVFVSADDFGSKTSIESNDDTYCTFIKHVSTYLIFLDGNDLDFIMKDAKAKGTKIFLFLMSPEYTSIAAEIMERGTELGVFDAQSQVIGTEGISTPLLLSSFSSGADVAEIMKGYMFLKFDSGYALVNDPSGQLFAQRFLSQEDTQWSESGTPHCLFTRDDNDEAYLYRNRGEGANAGYTCSGVEFSSLTAESIAPSVGQTYDAVIALALGLHHVIEASEPLTAAALQSSIIDNVDFDGVTGRVDIYEGE